jgi:hypothetical protein
LHREQLSDPLDGGIRSDDFPDPAYLCAVGSLSHEQSTGFAPQQDCLRCKQKANEDGCCGIQIGIVKRLA